MLIELIGRIVHIINNIPDKLRQSVERVIKFGSKIVDRVAVRSRSSSCGEREGGKVSGRTECSRRTRYFDARMISNDKILIADVRTAYHRSVE
jgi:hypothetical protein